MTKVELVKSATAKIEGATQKDMAIALDAFLESIKEELGKGGKVTLVSFGNFEVAERAERQGRNKNDYLLSFIRNKRFDRSCNMNVTFGCSHYLGVDMERMVRDHYFLCSAGILTASVRSNGDICACLDIVNKHELVQGNIQKDDFWDVWKNKFQVFRNDRTVTSTKCLSCSERFVCNGDSAHTWDYEKNQPLLCYRDFGSALNDNP